MKSNSLFLFSVIFVVALVLGAGIGIAGAPILHPAAAAVSYAPDSYQAVFLSNNQVYFGKLSNMSSQYPTLSNVYYIQAYAAQDLTSATNTGSQLQLVKLGSELHQPQNSMDINRDQILFIETLKPDSQIVKSISNFEKNQAS